MTLQEKAEKTVEKLLNLTQDQKIEWDMLENHQFLTKGTDNIVENAYMANQDGTYFVIFEARFQNMDAEERVYWTNRVELQMLSEGGTLLWTIPRTRTMWDLLQAVQIQAGDIEGRLDKFLED